MSRAAGGTHTVRGEGHPPPCGNIKIPAEQLHGYLPGALFRRSTAGINLNGPRRFFTFMSVAEACGCSASSDV